MPRLRQVDATTLRNLLATREQATALELADALEVSRPTVSRLLGQLGDEVVRVGAARAARYSLRRTIRGIGHTWPLHRVSEAGELIPAGNLEAVRGGFRLSDVPPILQADFPDGFFEGQPFFFNDVQPQGFLGRVQARLIAASLGVPTDAREWTAEDILVYLTTYGDDLPGDLVIGAEMAERIRRRDVGAITDGLQRAIPVAARAERYPELADRIMRGESFGSSAGGEQPKFATWLLDEGDLPRAVIVKFSPPTSTLAGRRWADLLLAESIALEVLHEAGVATPAVQVIDAGNRRFLEGTRYDRVGARGRRGVISLLSAEIGLLHGAIGEWPDAADALERQRLLTAHDAAHLRRLWCFGKLIGNVDMHKGNASLWWRNNAPLGLAPVYDMLPMAFGPSGQGEIVTRPYVLPARTAEMDPHWEVAIPWALQFWDRVLGDGSFAPDFVVLAQAARQRVEDFRSRAAPAAAPASPAAAVMFETRYPRVAQALQEQKKKTETTVTQDEKRRAAIRSEITAILAASEDLEPFVATLFPEGMAVEEFVQFSFDAYRYLGVNDDVRAFMGRLWLDVLRRWNPEARAAFLQRIIADKFQIFEALDFVSEVFRQLRFPPEVMLPWLQEARTKLGNDLYQQGFWKTVAALAERSPEDALTAAGRWLEQEPDEAGRQVIARIVGWVRARPDLSGAARQQLETLETQLRAKGNADWRALYLQSWAQLFGTSPLTEKKALKLRDEIAGEGPAELTAWCHVLATLIQADPLARIWAHRELARVASPMLPPTARYWITVASSSAWEEATDASKVSRDQWEALVLAVLPFGAEENGLWNRLDYFLREILERAPERTPNFVVRLARKAPLWLEKLKGRESEGYLSALRQHNQHEALATELCLGDSSAERQLGLHLFAKTGVEKLDPAQLQHAESRRLELIFRNAQNELLDYAALGRLHAILAPYLARSEEDFTEDFFDEVELQAKNSHAYRTALAKAAPENEAIRKILEEVEAYFRRLTEAATSPAFQMQVPGHFRAEQLFRRRFSRDLERSVDKHSVFLRMVKRVQLLYGKNWRMLSSGGELGAASALKESSHSVELPRVEFMDPEGMRLRRLHALQQIKQLGGSGEP